MLNPMTDELDMQEFITAELEQHEPTTYGEQPLVDSPDILFANELIEADLTH